MNRLDINTLCGHGNTVTNVVSQAIDSVCQAEQETTPRWFGMAAATPTIQDPNVLVANIPNSTGVLSKYYDQDNFLAVVTGLVPFESCPLKFQEYVGYKTAIRVLREQGAGAEDLKDLTDIVEKLEKELGALQLAYRSVICTRELAILRNRVLQHAGMPCMNDYSEIVQGWQIEQACQKTLDSDPAIQVARNTSNILLPYVAEYVVLKTAAQIKTDDGIQAQYLKARVDLVAQQARIGRVLNKYLTSLGTYFNTIWATLNDQDPVTLAAGSTILHAYRDPNGNLSKLHVSVPWDTVPGMLQSLILLEETVEDRAFRNDLSPVLQSEIILLDSRRKAWTIENDLKMSPPLPERELGRARNIALVYLQKQKQGEYPFDSTAFALEEYIQFAASQVTDLIPNGVTPSTFDPMWQYIALEAAKAVDPNLHVHTSRIASYYTHWINKWVPRNTAYDLTQRPILWTGDAPWLKP
jgi:hypothetical protein